MRMIAAVTLLLLPFSAFFVADALADYAVEKAVITNCDEELRLFGAEHNTIKIGNRERFMAAQWQIFRRPNGIVLILKIVHNFFWLAGRFSDDNETAIIYGLLYGKYAGNDVIWWARSRMFYQVSGEAFQDQLALLEKIQPFGVISRSRDLKQQIQIHYLCRKFIRDGMFFMGQGQNR